MSISYLEINVKNRNIKRIICLFVEFPRIFNTKYIYVICQKENNYNIKEF